MATKSAIGRWAALFPAVVLVTAVIGTSAARGEGHADTAAPATSDRPSPIDRLLQEAAPGGSTSRGTAVSIDGRPSAAGARFVLVTNDDGAIQIGITETWSVIDGSPWLGGDDVISASIWVAPDRRSSTTPGTGQA